MSGYFVVLDPQQAADGSFVAGFGEQSLAVSFATSESESGRALVVLDGGTGEQLYPPVAGSTDRAPRHSGMRLAQTVAGDGQGGDDDVGDADGGDE